MAGRDISLNIALEAAQAIADAERLKTGLEGVDEALEGTKTAGQQMADGLSSAAQDFTTEIEQTKRFADELGQALGPELSAKLGQSGLDEYAAALSAAGASGDELSAFARSIPGELAAGEQAARDLGRALGPELSAQLGQSGVEQLVADLHTGGLAFEEISQDADALGASIRQLDGVRTGNLSAGLDTVGTSTRQAGADADRTRGIFANMVGNSLGQLTGFSGALGPLAQGLGDVADEAVRGGSSLKQMAIGGAALAGVGIAVGVITSELNAMSKAKAFDKAQVDGYVDSIREGGDQVERLANRLQEAGEVKFTFFDSEADVVDTMSRLGLSVDQFSQLVIGGKPAIDQYKQAMIDVGAGGQDLDVVTLALTEHTGQYATAQERAKASVDVFKTTQESATRALESFIAKQEPLSQFPAEFARIGAAVDAGMTPSVTDLDTVMSGLGISIEQAMSLGVDATNRWKTSLEGIVAAGEAARAAGVAAAEATVAAGAAVSESGLAAAEGTVTVARDEAAAAADRASAAAGREAAALRDNVTALDERVSAQRASVDAGYALADSQDAFAVAVVAANTAMNDGTAGEQAAALRDLAQAAQTVADNTLRVAEAEAAANGTTLSRKAAIDTVNGALLAQAATLQGPAQAALVDHIAKLNDIPPKKVSEIQALIDAGKIAEAEALITKTSRTRKAAIKAEADEKEAENRLERAARKRTVPILAQAVAAGAESQLNRTARNRALNIAATAVTGAAEGGLNRTARNRALNIAAKAITAGAEGGLNRTARNRALNIAAKAITAGAEGDLNRTARDRALNIAATAITAGAEGDLNTTARDRDTMINVATTAAAAGSQIAGVANAYYQAVINVTAATGNAQAAINALRANAVITPVVRAGSTLGSYFD